MMATLIGGYDTNKTENLAALRKVTITRVGDKDYLDVNMFYNDYYTNDIDDYSTTDVTYIGKEKDDGTWLILKLDMASGTVIRGASETNNATYTDYATAWTNRLSLTYDYLKNVL